MPVPLYEGGAAIVDTEDWELVSAYRWRLLSHPRRHYAVTYRRVGGRHKPILLHRLILSAPQGVQVDHINGDGLDCRRSNLRLVSQSQNNANQGPRRGSYKGVRFLERLAKGPRPWRAQIGKDGRTIHLGYFATAEEAARAYDRAARELYGDFARSNFGEESQ